MRTSVVRLIAGRETRDLLRDRRTVMLILVLPAVLYPLFGTAGVAFVTTMMKQQSVLGVAGAEHLPAAPKFLDGDFFAGNPDDIENAGRVVAWAVDGDPDVALAEKRADAVLVVPPGFAAALAGPRPPELEVKTRDGDEKSKIAGRRLTRAVRLWEIELRKAKFRRAGLPDDFDTVFRLTDPQTAKPKEMLAADELRDGFVRAFPFILIMWLVAGAIQPAVDVTAGEKERGTMETLLISPATRAEIVFGKFLAVTAFGFGTVVWNVLWLLGGALAVQYGFGFRVVYLPGLLGCLLLAVPIAMLFGAVSIALGVFARSTKEGQYYLIPLLLTTLPLAFYSVLPGMELNAGTAFIPVTGAMLLQQRLLSTTAGPVPWEMFAPVLATQAAAVALALAAAVWQFKREDVLFRDVTAKKPFRLFKK